MRKKAIIISIKSHRLSNKEKMYSLENTNCSLLSLQFLQFNVSKHCQLAFLIQMDGLELFARKEYAVMTLVMAQIDLFFVRVILKTQKCK